jgi:hypothetical protein
MFKHLKKSSKSKEIKECMKGEEGKVYRNKYGGCCPKK